jgi:branched-subunit amino acid aminotransferase/4-amino-4-deoxychorismate lyase
MNIEKLSRLFWHNGNIENIEDRITEFYISSAFGFSFQEVTLTYGTDILFFDETFARISSLVKIYRFNSDLLADETGDYLKNEVKRLLVRNRYYKTARCIIMFQQNQMNKKAEEYIFIEPDLYLFSIGKIVQKCIFLPQLPKPFGAVMNLPTVDYEFKKLISNEIKREDADDCIIVNQNNIVSETFLGNIFLVGPERIITPSLNTHCNPGVMREVIVDELKKLNYPIFEEDYISEEDVMSSVEIFTAGTNGIFTIKGIGYLRFFDDVRKMILVKINEKLQKS